MMSFLGFKLWKVHGNGMTPLAPEGSYVLVNHWLTLLPIKINSRVLIKHNVYGVLLQKIAHIDKYGFIWSKGENKESMTIEKIGPINKNQIMGLLCYIIKQTP